MARTGTFDPQIQALAWFDTQAFAEGWFADDLIPPTNTGITGDLTVTLADVTLSADGTVANGASGDLAVTLAPVALAADGTITQPGITADLAVTLQDATLAASGTVPAGEQTRGGFYSKQDRKRLERLAQLQAQRRDRQRDEQDIFRNALGAAYDAALGLVDEPAAETRAEVREAIAEAAQTAPEPYRAEVQRLRDLARQAETLAQIERVVTRIAAIQARAEADADDDDAVLMLMG
jgi:polyisoprenoid-binding protein YceI